MPPRRLIVEAKGVDVYDPTTGQVRSGGVDQVALWMIDTDYDAKPFFGRHCYVTVSPAARTPTSA